VYGDSSALYTKLAGRQFDCIVLSNLLHLIPEPETLLSSLAGLLSPHGTVIASVPNLARLSVLGRRISRNPLYRDLGRYSHSGLHLASFRRVRRWFALADLRVVKTVSSVPEHPRWLYRLAGRLMDGSLAEGFSVLARRA
jgi:2-polyprenyl-3-methyl-5-hydroxy-6-metoxy-1,4-benzoquinol methylase